MTTYLEAIRTTLSETMRRDSRVLVLGTYWEPVVRDSWGHVWWHHATDVSLYEFAKDTYLQAQFLRLRARRGPKKAIMAVAASILTAVYHMLNHHLDYRDLGPNHFNGADKVKSVNRLLRRIETLGFEVTGIRERQAA